MAVQVSYPGVYIQEVSSGARTITGVSTSVAMFVGFTSQGPLNKPTLLFSFTDYERAFGPDTSASEMATQVRLFFQNGGERCYVMRIADNAVAATSTMANEAGDDTLVLTARNPGTGGQQIRAEVDYATPTPGSTFNLRVFVETETSPGVFSQSKVESHKNLSMDPASGRFVVDVLANDSDLVVGTSLAVAPAAGASYSDRLFDGNDILRDVLDLEEAAGRTDFRISIDGGSTFTPVTIGPVPDAPADGTDVIQSAIDASALGGGVVTVSLQQLATSAWYTIRIVHASSDTASVVILPGSTLSADIATTLGLGAGQGGIEIGAYAGSRPAPTGSFHALGTDLDNLNEFAILDTDDITLLEVDDGGTAPHEVDLTLLPAGQSMYASGVTSYESYSNVRHKLDQIASAFNTAAAGSVTFNWAADVEGAELVLRPVGSQSSNFTGAVTTTAALTFGQNARFYRLGLGGLPATFQSGTAGNDGTAPATPSAYSNAYEIIDAEVDLFNLLVLPRSSGVDRTDLWGAASVFCQQRRAFLLVDPPEWTTVQDVLSGTTVDNIAQLRAGLVKDHAAVYWPRLSTIDTVTGLPVKVDPSGAVAGIMARTDGSRGVWKAAAGIEADVRGVQGLERMISDPENGVINPQAVNALRVFPNGITVWGARTMDGFDNSGNDDYKYAPVRRFALFIEESLVRGLKFAVFEPNGEVLWAQIRLTAGSFMNNLFRQGAFAGTKASDAYFVKCDRSTTTQNDINLGIVNVIVGFAPLKPAEFVVISLQQKAGEIQV
ncbi:phage tail sheath subtilisin-like domain-containing protein [Paraliomyxa miuraensis]|uniref:phage tail sheath subtilisin-like domain-containing protein n=1 Tax=Paraliomyxa miuraensis TaxID=376150 RepID=UPI0022565366|nr:phage tail sheath subtilisin-like domain-containing protein [Paraliomyxa miuraensis]MCX4247474.1 DUF2586 family protein [Paraliomyxa miuraensis]